MADLEALHAFAEEHQFGLTRPLSHEQVVTLASYWQPHAWFHVDERFHPIALGERVTMVEQHFVQLPPDEQKQLRVSELIRNGPGAGAFSTFDPPVVYVPDGTVSDWDPASDDEPPRAAVRVINSGTSILTAFEEAQVGEGAVFTHGATAPRAREFFGATQTAAGASVGTAGDGLLPRANGITVMASYQNLLDLLKYELLVEENVEYPPDGLRGGFDIAGLLFEGGTVPVPSAVRRQILLDLIAAREAGDLSGETPGLPPDWRLNKRAWDCVTRYAFLEYDFFYAYNDWERFQVALWDNQHEGDDEGCCLVFERNLVDLAARNGDGDQLRRVVPLCIITCVHEELQDADDFDFVPAPIPPSDDPAWLPRDDLVLNVYIAGGSHATYLTPGTHDVVDFGDFWAYVEDAGTVLAALPLLPILVILAIFEHFQDTEDFTSEDGVHTGPNDVVGDDPGGFPPQLVVMPLSAGNHIYDGQHAELLRLRAYAGTWGGHDGLINHSPRFVAKSGRYFRKLLRSL